MRKGGGKQKGAAFEREVCVLLSSWLSSGTQEDIFWRSAMSGGRSTVAFKKGKKLSTQVGDISCIHSLGECFINKFAVECKFYADLNYEGLLTGKGKLLTFWAEIFKQARIYSKHPMLICRQNRVQATVALDKAGMNELGLSDAQTLLISVPNDLYLLGFDNFLQICKPFI